VSDAVKILAGLVAGFLGLMALSSGKSQGSGGGGSASAGPRQRRRRARDLQDLPRSAALSHLYRSAEAASPPNHPPLGMFSASALWEWARHYLAYVFHKKHPFPAYTDSPQHAIYDLRDEKGAEDVRIALAGDWGTGTEEAESVATRMLEFAPHFTIHIGDVYYVGDPPEVNENCLGVRSPLNNYDPLTWPIGTRGSFALNGNHEMYANGTAYFELFLPRLGLRDAGGSMLGQQTSFFCLENSHWRIVAIDTGYNSIGVPILSHIPLINRIPGVGGDCRLPDAQMEWLTQVVAPDQDKRGLVILSHHQYYSGFDEEYRKPAQQLWQAGVRRPVLWFWGHEHRLAGYDLYGQDDLKCFGRCVGHGGMPIDRGDAQHDPRPVFWDDRLAANGYGVNGHVNLSFAGPNLSAVYVDLDGNNLLEEQWSVDANGGVQQVARKRLTDDRDFHA
jgi:hypothetical protein